MNKITVVGVHALIKKGDHYLATRRALLDDYMPGYWDIPGGTVEFGEEITVALKWEIREEVGLKVNIQKPIFACNYLSGEYRFQFMIIYICEYISGEPKLSHDHDEYRWVNLNQLGKLKKIGFLKQLYLELKKY